MASQNFYELLKLDPSITDRAQIEKAIERNRQEWVRWGDNPVREGEARLYLGLLPRIRKVLLEPESESQRRAQAEEYRKRNQSDGEELDQMLRLDAGKELRIEESRFHELLGIFSKTSKSNFTEQQVRERCKQLRISIVSKGTIPEEPELLDTAMYRDIEKNLGIAGDSDLYAMLKVPFGFKHRQKLLAEAESVLKEARLRPSQAAWTAKSVLAGHCLVLFKDEVMQNRYDRTAQQAKIGSVLNPIIDQATHNGVLTPQWWEHLLNKAKAAGLSEEIATSYITNRVGSRVGGKNSAAFEKHVKAANDAVERNELKLALEELERARSIQPEHSDIVILEKRITERQELAKANAELRAAIIADNDERCIVSIANRRAELTDQVLTPSDAARVADAQIRTQLLDRFSGTPTQACQTDDEAFRFLWEQSSNAASQLTKSRDPECRKLLKLADDVNRRLKQIQNVRIAAEIADRNETKESELQQIAAELPRGYWHAMQPRLAMSAALLRVPPDAASKTEAWIKLKSSEYNVQECYFRNHCEELAKKHAARTVLEPLLSIEDESSDRRYLRVWDDYGFASAHLDERFERRMRSARNRVTLLTQLSSAVGQIDATLTNELAIVKATQELPRDYNYDLELRVALARQLTAEPQSDSRIAEVWEKLRKDAAVKIPPETIKRCDLAVLRRDNILKLRSLAVGIEVEYDRQFVQLWHDAELETVSDAKALKPEFSKATVYVAAVNDFEHLSLHGPFGLKGEASWVAVNERLPPGYLHPWKLRVELATSLTSLPVCECQIADSWRRLEGSSVLPADIEIQSRCLLAARRANCLNKLEALEASRPTQELRDKTFVEVWDNTLFEGCDEANRWREEAVGALLRGRDLMELEQALREGVDYLKIKRLASSPRLKLHHAVLSKHQTQIENACRQAVLIEKIQQSVRDNRGQEFFGEFESVGIIRNQKVLSFYWPEIGDFVVQWWQSRLNMRLGDQEYIVSPDRRQVFITWKFDNPGLETWFEFATTNECHSGDLFDPAIRPRTQKLSIAQLAAIGGRITLPAPATGKLLFVTVWAVTEIAEHVLVSAPLQVGPISNIQGTNEKTQRKSWKGYLWRLLNN
jgi:hypothetical protein